MPPVPVEESAAAATPAARELTVVEPVVTELPPVVPAMESEDVQPGESAAGLLEVGLPEPAAQAAAVALAAEAVTAVRLVSEALSALDLTLGAGVLAGVPAAVEPAAAIVAASAAEPAAVERERAASAGQWASGSLKGVLGAKRCSRTQSDTEKGLGWAGGDGGRGRRRLKCGVGRRA